MVIEAARRIYDNQESVSELDVQMYEAVLASFHNAIAEGLADAVSSGTGAVSDEFLEQLRSSNEVFSTFKVHRMQRDIASQLFTAEGKLKSRSRFVKDVLPIASHHVKAWLRTEYDTAVLRAHQAADWLQFERDKDILPNLRWMPSTSITPGEDHRVFWNTVLPIEHRFWSVHRPGDRWNCKCRLEATDDAPTAVPMVEKNDKKNNPARGLENNPAKDGHVFSDKHSYFPSSCASCPFGNKKGSLFALAAKKKGDCYECARVKNSVEIANKSPNAREYELYKKDKNYSVVKYDENNGGVLAIHNEHNFDTDIGRFGIQRGEYEKRSSEALYKSGHSIILKGEQGEVGVKQPDGYLDGELMDIKGIEGNCLYAMNRANRQQVHTVVLYFHDAQEFNFDSVKSKWEYLPEWINNNQRINNKTVYLQKIVCVVNKSNGYDIYEI
ncbi:MAG: hypothetical protein J6R43_04205 [Paludibacteraceae bacterium]|nr:hypothetical protein [Paludibacteraceae bacterium]